jgi:hypothetical protein
MNFIGPVLAEVAGLGSVYSRRLRPLTVFMGVAAVAALVVVATICAALAPLNAADRPGRRPGEADLKPDGNTVATSGWC